MGQAIVPRLIAAGHTVTGWNRTKEKAAPLFQLGMLWAESPREVARESEMAFSIVTDTAAQGLAVQLKVALNMTLVIEVIGFCEGVALAEKGGVPREVAVDAMLKSVVASPVLHYRAPLILEGHLSDATYGNVNLQQKDMLLALDLGRKCVGRFRFAPLPTQG